MLLQPNLKLSDQLVIGDNYTKSMVGVPSNQLNQGIYVSTRHTSILIISTIFNNNNWVNYKLDDNHFVYTTDPNQLKSNKELLLFVRKDQSTGFYYFGRCNFVREITVAEYFSKACILQLLDTTFSNAVAKLPNNEKEILHEIGLFESMGEHHAQRW